VPVFVLLALPGCDRPPLSTNGVVGVFGGVGLAGGEFNYPRGITIGPDHCVYVVDKSARVQRFSSEGVFETGWRMPEFEAGKPVGLKAHPDGRIFIADTHYHRVIVYDRDGHELARFGSHGRGAGEFELPTDVAFDADGNVYVAEYYGNDRITKWSADLKFMSVLVSGEIDGKPLARPAGIDFDAEQTLWCADACNHRILRFDRQGRLLARFGELGDGPGQMRYPYDLAVVPDALGGGILVCEFEGNRLQWFSKDGKSLRTWGSVGRELGQVWMPWGVAVGADGRIYVVDSYNSRVQIIRP
jgi:DNA-binding beta-propeller fold protein YncE